MTFKLDFKDFELIVKYIEQNVSQCTLNFKIIQESRMEISFDDKNSNLTQITVYAEETQLFPKITFTERLTKHTRKREFNE